MGRSNVFKIYHPGSRKFSPLKNTIKLLSFCEDPKIQKEILSRAPDNVIKRICDATLNVQRGPVHLTKRQKQVLARNRQLISKLVNKDIPLHTKRRQLVQTGGQWAQIVPIILSTVLQALGSTLFQR